MKEKIFRLVLVIVACFLALGESHANARPSDSLTLTTGPLYYIGGNAGSRLAVTTSEVQLSVCADNIRSHDVWVLAQRGPVSGYSGRSWAFKVNPQGYLVMAEFGDWNNPTGWQPMSGAYSIPITCLNGVPGIRIYNMDGPGNTFAGVTYKTEASYFEIEDLPPMDMGIPNGCYSTSGGTALCDWKSR